MTPKISAVVMIYNEERQIRACLESIRWADEIVICDSFSTDRTIGICREFTDRIYQRKFDNFRNQKNWLMTKPTHQWMLFVEADERYTPELAGEIRDRLSRDEGFDGYRIPYRCFVFGREMKGKYWQENRVRLFKKDKAGWEDKLVHENLILNGTAGQLKNPLLHYPYPRLSVMFDKFSRYTALEAKQLIVKNTAVGPLATLKALGWIPVRFWRFFFAWGDYKSGWPGFVFAFIFSFYVIATNIKYWMLRLRGWHE